MFVEWLFARVRITKIETRIKAKVKAKVKVKAKEEIDMTHARRNI